MNVGIIFFTIKLLKRLLKIVYVSIDKQKLDKNFKIPIKTQLAMDK